MIYRTINKSTFSELTGPYFGQSPPPMKAKLFAPGLLSIGGSENRISFGDNGNFFVCNLFSTAGNLIPRSHGAYKRGFTIFSKIENNKWIEPNEVPISCSRDLSYTSISPNGKILIFNYRSPKYENHNSVSCMYISNISNGSWGEPIEIKFENDINGKKLGIAPTIAHNHNIYFTIWPNGGEKGILCMSKFENGTYSRFEQLPNIINQYGGNHPYISPDERYLLYDTVIPNQNIGEKNNIFVSFQDPHGGWSKPYNLGPEVNSQYHEFRPTVSGDGKYLFFASNRVGNSSLPNHRLSITEINELTHNPTNGYQKLYWIDAQVIENLNPFSS